MCPAGVDGLIPTGVLEVLLDGGVHAVQNPSVRNLVGAGDVHLKVSGEGVVDVFAFPLIAGEVGFLCDTVRWHRDDITLESSVVENPD